MASKFSKCEICEVEREIHYDKIKYNRNCKYHRIYAMPGMQSYGVERITTRFKLVNN